MLDKPPDRLFVVLQLIILSVVMITVGFLLGQAYQEWKDKVNDIKNYRIQEYIDRTNISETIIYNRTTLASNIGIVKTEKDEILEAIAFCESSNNPRAYNRTSGAKGLYQIIPSSERFCEEGLGRDLDMFDPDDNELCAKYLMEHGGLAHWKASKRCWIGLLAER